MKLPRQFVALVFIGLCLMAYFNYNSGTNVESPQSEGPLKSSLETTAEPCQPKSFWEEYDIWGDTDTIYAPSDEADESKPGNETPADCEEPIEPKE